MIGYFPAQNLKEVTIMKNVLFVENKYYVTSNDYGVKFVNTIDKSVEVFPFEDIEWLIFCHKNSYFSNRLIQTCLENNVGIMFCDNKMTPLTLFVSETCHNDRLTRLKEQIDLSTRTKNRLWRKIVISKILNQAEVIKNNCGECETYQTLIKISKDVLEGDYNNRESYAAKLYFSKLFGKRFKRGRYTDDINAGLNYGYAILRAAIKRSIAIHGLEGSLGINHHSIENSYNLADDIIEPFRPMIDEFVYTSIYESQSTFDKTVKREFYTILLKTCIIDNRVLSINDSIEVFINSLIRCISRNNSTKLLLPKMKEFGE